MMKSDAAAKIADGIAAQMVTASRKGTCVLQRRSDESGDRTECAATKAALGELESQVREVQ